MAQIRQSGHALYFVSTCFADARRDTTTRTEFAAYLKSRQKFWQRVIQMLTRQGERLLVARCGDIKGMDAVAQFQLHDHALVALLPHPTDAGRQTEISAHQWVKIKHIAHTVGLKVHFEPVRDDAKACNYLIASLKKLERIVLPSGFRRSHFSGDWQKLEWQKKRIASRQLNRMLAITLALKQIGLSFDDWQTASVLLLVLAHSSPPRERPSPHSHQSLSATQITPVQSDATANADKAQLRQTISLRDICTDGGTQARQQTSDTTVREYAKAMTAGIYFPPVVVFRDADTLYLADGFHRVEAACRCGFEMIEALVFEGTRRDALYYALSANKTHGLPRSNKDKRRAVTIMLEEPDWSSWSDSQIASHCAVSQPFVSKLREELTYNGDKSAVRLGRDGRLYNVEGIGKRGRGRQSVAVSAESAGDEISAGTMREPANGLSLFEDEATTTALALDTTPCGGAHVSGTSNGRGDVATPPHTPKVLQCGATEMNCIVDHKQARVVGVDGDCLTLRLSFSDLAMLHEDAIVTVVILKEGYAGERVPQFDKAPP